MCGAASGQTRLCPTMPRFSAFAWHTHQPLSTAANGKQPRQVATQREGMRHRRGGLDVQHDMPPPSGHEQDLAGPLDDHARSIGPVCPRRGSHVRVADLPADPAWAPACSPGVRAPCGIQRGGAAEPLQRREVEASALYVVV